MTLWGLVPPLRSTGPMRSLTRSVVAALVTTVLCSLGCETGAAAAEPVPAPEPEVFAPGVVSTSAEEYRITVSPDGRTAWFARAERPFPEFRESTIMVTHRTRDGWTTPEVAPFSGAHPDLDPYLSPDGRRIYFSSIRPVNGEPRQDADIWMVQREQGGWSEPVHVGGAPGTNEAGEPVDDLYPTITAQGEIFYGSNRDGGYGGWDLYRGHLDRSGQEQAVTNLGSDINTAAWEYNPVVAPGRKGLVFTRLAGQEPPFSELMIAPWHRREFIDPRPLPVNSDLPDYHASFSADGRTTYFVRLNVAEEPWHGDILTIPTRYVLTPEVLRR